MAQQAPEKIQSNGTRKRDGERTREEILSTATEVFAEQGYGATVDGIAARTNSAKRMIYYYFGDKEQLYIAVLERAYKILRSAESDLDVEHLTPAEAIRTLAEFMYDHHERNPACIRLVSIENIHEAEHLAKSKILDRLRTPALEVIGRILARGQAQGVFRRDADALDVHMMISSFCVFQIANRHTFKVIFNRDLREPTRMSQYRTMVGDLIVAYLTSAHTAA